MPTSLLRAGPLAADFVGGANRPTFTTRNSHRLSVWPQSIDTETFYTFNMPTVFAEGDIKVKLTWMAESLIINDVIWAVAFERHQNFVDDLDSDSFAADIIAAAATVPGVAGQTIETVITVTAAQYDGLTQGDQFRLRVRRLGTNVNDTLLDNAQLMTVVIDQQADPVGGGGGGFWSDGVGTRAGIGQGSPAPTAAGQESLAHGSGSSADADNTLALLAGSSANYLGSMSLGHNSRSESPDHIHIGRDFTASTIHTSNDLITIGRDHSNPTNVCLEGIGIGFNHEMSGTRPIAIGTQIKTGPYNIIIGHSHGTNAQQDGHSMTYNIVMKTDKNNLSGIDNRDATTPGSPYGNIVFVAGSFVGGLDGSGGFSQQRNVFIGSRSTIRGNANLNVNIGPTNQVGLTGGTDLVSENVVIGSRITAFHYSDGPSRGNVVIGSFAYVYDNTVGNVCLGHRPNIYTYGSYTRGNIVMGDGCRVNGQGNQALGVGSSAFRPGTLSPTNSRGNFVAGFGCESIPTGDVPWRSTIAQGCGAKVFLKGHRAFSADSQIDNAGADAVPNQGGFVIPKIETTDATQTTLMIFPTAPDKAYAIWGWVVARRTDVDGENEVFRVDTQLVFRNATGGPTLVGDPVSWTSDANQGTPGLAVDFSISTNDIVARVTGVVAKTFEWIGWIQVLEIRG